MDRDNDEIESIAEKLHQVHIDRHRLYEKEKHLIRQLIEARSKKSSAQTRPRASSPGEVRRGDREPRTSNRRSNQRERADRYGTPHKVGDDVEVLTQGRTVGKIWTIYKFTDRRVLLERNNGIFKTHRDYKNVRKLV